MFSVGEKVCCIVDGWPHPDERFGTKFPLRRNGIYTVLRVLPVGFQDGQFVSGYELVRIGVINPYTVACAEHYWPGPRVFDAFPAHFFRRLERKDISEALATLIGLFDTTKATEVVDA